MLMMLKQKTIACKMEALWSLEDRWKLSTKEAVLFFGCTAFAAIGVVIGVVATFLRKSRKKQLTAMVDAPDHHGRIRDPWRHDQDDDDESTLGLECAEPRFRWVTIKRVLMSSLRWSRANKWEEKTVRKIFVGESPAPPLLLGPELGGNVVGWQSHNSESPVWQRPILMGEKCELPRFSGLILYDERGRLLHDDSSKDGCITNQDPKKAGVGRTTLRDLL